MKNLSELNGDEFFDVLYALTPILPALENIDLVDIYLNGGIKDKNMDSKAVTKIFVQGVGEILKLVTSKENRSCAFEVLAIVDGVTVAQARKYLAPQIWLKLKSLFSGEGIKAFFKSAEQSDTTE